MNQTAASALAGLRVMVVEDEYFLADDIARVLAREGAEVLGPVPTVDRARALLDGATNAAVLDIDLRGEPVFPIADLLAERDARFVFVSGMERRNLPKRFAGRPHLHKPVSGADVVKALGLAVIT